MEERYTKMITAKRIRDLEGFTGTASLWKLSKPFVYTDEWKEEHPLTTDHVVVSATVAMMSGPETYIFASNAEGEILDWAEREGSYRGGLNHEAAVVGAGWEVG